MTDQSELERLRVEVVNLKGDLEAEKAASAKARRLLRALAVSALDGICAICGTREGRHTEACILSEGP